MSTRKSTGISKYKRESVIKRFPASESLGRLARPILITGAHRSGTSWVAKIISSSPGIQYIHEPFNVDYKEHEIRPDYWFQYVTTENEAPLYEPIRALLNSRPAAGSKKQGRPWKRWLSSAPAPPRPLIKDPIAIFSVEWLASRFQMDVVVLIRHPAAFVDSIRNRNWTHDFSHFLNQPRLMEEHLFSFQEEIIQFAEKPHDIFDQAVLLWKLIYHMVSKYRQKHSDWLFIRHEDLSLDPEGHFRRIFAFLNIPFRRDTKKIIAAHSDMKNPIEGDVHSIKRNSQAVIKKWKKRLTPQQVKTIKESVELISKEFYSAEDW